MADAIVEMIEGILAIETSMFGSYDRLLPELKDGGLKKTIASIREDEKKHISLATRALEIVKG